MSSLSKEQYFAVIGSLESNNKRDKRKKCFSPPFTINVTPPGQTIREYECSSAEHERPQSTASLEHNVPTA